MVQMKEPRLLVVDCLHPQTDQQELELRLPAKALRSLYSSPFSQPGTVHPLTSMGHSAPIT